MIQRIESYEEQKIKLIITELKQEKNINKS